MSISAICTFYWTVYYEYECYTYILQADTYSPHNPRLYGAPAEGTVWLDEKIKRDNQHG